MAPFFGDHYFPIEVYPPDNAPFPEPLVLEEEIIIYVNGVQVSIEYLSKIRESIMGSEIKLVKDCRTTERLLIHLTQRQLLLQKIYMVEYYLKLDEELCPSQYQILRTLIENGGDVVNTVMSFL